MGEKVAGAGGRARKPMELERMAERSRSRLRFAAPALVALYEVAAIVVSAWISYRPDGMAFWVSEEPWKTIVLLTIALAATALLLARFKAPLATLSAEAALYAWSATGGSTDLLVLPFAVAFYALMAYGRPRQMAAGAAICALALASEVVGEFSPADRGAELLGRLSMLAVIAACAFAVRLWRGRREARMAALEADVARARAEAAQAREAVSSAERDRALALARIAAELHDSVGHGLTTIVSLSEGLAGATGDPDLDDALAGINQVARESLAKTREAVAALEPARGGFCMSASALHGWDEIEEVLDHARMAGLVVAITETGRRSDDPVQADLAFSVSREAVTNAMRHARDVGSVVVSWDHAADGSVEVTVRDDGSVEDAPAHVPAGGLSRLEKRVRACGGSFSCGLITRRDGMEGWRVKAVIPSQAEEARSCGGEGLFAAVDGRTVVEGGRSAGEGGHP